MKANIDLNDSELLRLMLGGDEEAFTQLYRRRQGGIYRFVVQMCGSPSVAEDVTQEVFLFLMRQGKVFDPARGSLSSFLLGVARNFVLRRLRGDQVMVPLVDEFDDDSMVDQVSVEPVLLEELTRAETVDSVRRAILSLPERYREVVVLCELQEMSYVETAEILGCAIGTVRSRLHRARSLLLTKLRPAEVAEEADGVSVKSARCFA